MDYQDDEDSDGTFIAHEPCPSCGSRDNLSRYTDGHGYCHGCKYREPRTTPSGTSGRLPPSGASGNQGTNTGGFTPVTYDISPLPKRGLSAATCEFWDYGVGTFGNEGAHFANYRSPDTRELIAQKVRTPGKDFPVLKGKATKLPLYGQWLWKNDRRSLVITEGELDALSVSQAQDNKYPVVSLPYGAHNALKAIKENYEWLCSFDKIVLMFDMDTPGRDAAVECAEVLPVGKVFIADLDGYKDANEALADGKPSAIISAFWGAKAYQPDGIFTLSDIKADVLRDVELGSPWFLPSLTKLTFGRRDGETYYFGAGTGVGKTDFFTQQIEYDVSVLNIKTACIYLEMPPAETGKRIAGKHAKKLFHIPDDNWTQDELIAAFDELEATGNLFLGGNFASASWDQIKVRIRFLAHALGVKHVYLDHLTALADPTRERESLEIITKELALLAQELKIVIHVISHLSTPDGKSHEEGGRVMLRHFKGSRAIGFWAHFAFGLERNPQDEDAEAAQQTTLRCLKDRYTGRANGKTVMLGYDVPTGMISESPLVAAINLDI